MQGTSRSRSGEGRRRVVAAGQVLPLRESFVATLRPPRLAVQRREVAQRGSIIDDEEPRHLEVAAIGCLDGGFEDEPDVVDRDRIGPEATDGSAA